MERVLRAVRMQYANATAYFWVPAIIAFFASCVTVLIALIVPTQGPIYSGAANAPIWFFATAGIQSVLLTFPFALAMGVTRWEYSVSTFLAAVGAAGSLALFAMALGWAEKLTDGWWVGAYAFHLPWFWKQGPLATWLLFTFICVVLFQVAYAFTVVYKRYGMMPMVILMIGLVLALLIPIWVITANSWWPQTLAFFAGLTPLEVGGMCLVASVVISSLGYLALRKYEVR
ncbi:MAG: hypothetical protein WAS54_04310 [Scrofimicrobium sp.]